MFHYRALNVPSVPASFATLEEAVAYGKARGFEFAVDGPNGVAAAWGVFSGLRLY